MRKLVNGVYMDMTEDEMQTDETIPQMPTSEERIEALEMAMLEMLEVMANG